MGVGKKFTFADFSYDCETGELTRKGRKLRIPDQAARLLTILLEKDGLLVSREEIRSSLWPQGEYLDYDHSINKAISQLRAILRDDRQAPKFLETIPKRGYRFLGAAPILERIPEIQSVEEARTPEPGSESASPKEQHLQIEERQRKRPFPKYWIGFAVAVCLLFAAGIGFYLQKRQSAPHIVRIGILPFVASGDGANQLAESLRMDLTDSLSELPEVEVKAAHSLEGVGSGDEVIRKITKSLQLDSVLYGHFTLEANRFVLELELIRGTDAAHLASFHYEGTRQQLPILRTKVQRDIFSRLALTRESPQHALGRTTDPRAYEGYLRGRSLLEEATQDSLQKAYAEFETATQQDPNFAAAYAGMAQAEMVLAEHEVIPAKEAFLRTRELANRALEKDPSMAEAHALLGYSAFRLDWDLATGERELRQALELDPHQVVYHVWIAVLLCDEGRFNESFQHIDEAHALEPLWAPIFLTEAFVGAGARNYDRMIAAAEKLVAMMPDWSLSHGQLAWSLWFAGREQEAIGEWRKMAEIEKDSARVELEERGLGILHSEGRRGYAALRLKASLNGPKSTHLNDFVPSEWYSYAGQKEAALNLLTEMVARHDQEALDLMVNPAYFDMHSDPRFRNLARQAGLPISSRQ